MLSSILEAELYGRMICGSMDSLPLLREALREMIDTLLAATYPPRQGIKRIKDRCEAR